MDYQLTAKNQIQRYSELLQREGLKVSGAVQDNFCYESDVTDGNEKIKLRVYFGKKGLKTVLQGNKTGSLYKKTEEIIFGKKFFEFNDDEIIEPPEYIGTDESGKGDYFGPLIIAGVLADNKMFEELKNAGVRDSKLVPDSMIAKIASSIKKITGNKYSVVFISPAKYNEIYLKFGNLNRLLAWGHSRAIENILASHNTETVISDKFGDESLIKNSLFEKGKKVNLFQYHKAEKYTAVAAASILARNELNNWFRMQEKKYNMSLPKGASGAVEDAAALFLKKYGWEVMKEIVKTHFKTTKKILNSDQRN